MKHIPFKSLYKVDHGWLQSHFHFSFAEYHDKNNMHFGVLRVMNDDVIASHSGFSTHPHRDMEILTYVIRGELTHEDSMENKETLGRGSLQYLSAGTGITHSEKNEGNVKVHLIQLWILPRAEGLKSQYGSKVFDFEARHNTWLHMVGPGSSEDRVTIYQDANMYVSELDSKKTLHFDIAKGRQVYLKVMEGMANVNGTVYDAGDAGEISEEDISILASRDTHLLLVEMSSSPIVSV